MTLHGIDVSKYQGRIDWPTAAASGLVQFAILRVGLRGYGAAGTLREDTYFRANLAGCEAAGIPVGLYFYSQATTEAEAAEEARFVLERIGGHTITWPIWYDVECANQGSGRADKLSPAQRTACARAFCEVIRAAGYTPGVYSYTAWLNSALDMAALSAYDVWVADYRKNCGYKGRHEMWQYSSSGSVPGIDGRCDVNICYKDYRKENDDMELVTLKIGPVSGGDKRTIEALAQTLGIPVQAQGDCLIVGPASKGDVRTIEAKCAELLLPAANQAEPEDEPGQDTPAPEADRLAAIEAKLDALLAALRAAAKAAEGT